MLLLALVAMIVGIVCLYLEMEAYHFKLKAATEGAVVSPSAVAMTQPLVQPREWLVDSG